MKLLALLFLVVLGEGADVHDPNEYDHNKNVSEMTVSRTLVVEQYQNAALGFPSPAIEWGDTGGEKFKVDFNRIGARWGQEIFDLVYHQAVAEGHKLIDAVKDKYNALEKSVRRSSKNGLEDDCNVEREMEDLVTQLKTFLDLKPGNQKIEHKPLRKLPDIPTKIVSRTKNRTASDFFLHYPEFFDEDMACIYGYVAGIYLSGWSNSRKYSDLVQTQYRNEILNGPVLHAYRKIVANVFKNGDYIEKCVTKDTWESFKAAGTLIIKICNEWQDMLAKLESS